MTDIDIHTLHKFTYGHPFVVRSNGKEKHYPANAAWIEEEDGSLNVAATVEREHERLHVTFSDEPLMSEGGVISYIGDVYPAGSWELEKTLPE